MNKVVTSAGLLALSAAALYGYDPEMTRAQTGRPWTIAATVRGFYDDNPVLTPDNGSRYAKPTESFGVEVSPSVSINLPLEQTFIRAGYNYSLRYYDDRSGNDVDQSHEFNALLKHTFSPRSDISVADAFVYSDEPSVVDKVGIVTAPTRTDATALHNHGAIDYNLGLTEVFGLGFGYANEWYDYDDSGPGSRSATLDRLEHYFRLDLRYQVNPTLVGLIGYQLGLTEYTGDEFLYPGRILRAKSDIRDSTSHYIYLGADHDFTSKLRASVRIGAQFIDYDNVDEDDVSPYADANLTYAYSPGSSLQVGIKHMRAATDVTSTTLRGLPTLDQEVTAAYVQVTHQITQKLTASVLGQLQHGVFNGGRSDDDSEDLFMVGVNANYRLDHHWSLEAGYNFDLLDSDITGRDPVTGQKLDLRSYDRNRVYLGVRATY